MISALSLRPVSCVTDWLRSTSFSFFRPSGVISNAQAKNSATGSPNVRSNNTVLITQTGASKLSSASSATWAISQAIST